MQVRYHVHDAVLQAAKARVKSLANKLETAEANIDSTRLRMAEKGVHMPVGGAAKLKVVHHHAAVSDVDKLRTEVCSVFEFFLVKGSG